MLNPRINMTMITQEIVRKIRSIKAKVLASSMLLGIALAPSARAFTDADATTLFNKFNEAFYSGSGNAYFKSNKSGGDTGFWQQAEIMEMVCDRYNKAPSQGVKDMISALCSGFVGIRGSNWGYNGFNDDLCWASMVFSRAYQKTGNTQFRDIAKTNFDIMYARAWNTSFLGGGLWWLYPNNNSKNSCVEGPGAIAAYWIYQNTGDSSYLTKAQNILGWERSNLFNETTGAVWDSVNTSMIYSKVALTYNQGTFIRACDHLGQTGGATKACDYMKNTLGTVVGADRGGVVDFREFGGGAAGGAGELNELQGIGYGCGVMVAPHLSTGFLSAMVCCHETRKDHSNNGCDRIGGCGGRLHEEAGDRREGRGGGRGDEASNKSGAGDGRRENGPAVVAGRAAGAAGNGGIVRAGFGGPLQGDAGFRGAGADGGVGGGAEKAGGTSGRESDGVRAGA